MITGEVKPKWLKSDGVNVSTYVSTHKILTREYTRRTKCQDK